MARPRKEPTTEPAHQQTEWSTPKGFTVKLINGGYFLYAGNSLLNRHATLEAALSEEKILTGH